MSEPIKLDVNASDSDLAAKQKEAEDAYKEELKTLKIKEKLLEKKIAYTAKKIADLDNSQGDAVRKQIGISDNAP